MIFFFDARVCLCVFLFVSRGGKGVIDRRRAAVVFVSCSLVVFPGTVFRFLYCCTYRRDGFLLEARGGGVMRVNRRRLHLFVSIYLY